MNKTMLWHKFANSISITRVKSTKIGLKETESNKAFTRVIRNKLYGLLKFLRSYKVQQVEFFIRSDRCEVSAEYGIANQF